MYVNIFFPITENHLKKYRKNNIKHAFSYCFSNFENVLYIYRQETGKRKPHVTSKTSL